MLVADIVGRDVSEIGPHDSFSRLGLDSANSVTLLLDLESWLGVEVDTDAAGEHRTLAELAAYLVALQ